MSTYAQVHTSNTFVLPHSMCGMGTVAGTDEDGGLAIAVAEVVGLRCLAPTTS